MTRRESPHKTTMNKQWTEEEGETAAAWWMKLGLGVGNFNIYPKGCLCWVDKCWNHLGLTMLAHTFTRHVLS